MLKYNILNIYLLKFLGKSFIETARMSAVEFLKMSVSVLIARELGDRILHCVQQAINLVSFL